MSFFGHAVLINIAQALFWGKFSLLTTNFFYNLGHAPPPPPPTPYFNFRTKQGPKVSVSNINDIAFYRSSEILHRPEISQFFPCMLQFLGNLWWLFIFSNYIVEVDHFKMDLLKRIDTLRSTLRKVSTQKVL